ncbi:MAG: glycogen/starch synthase [Ilumatobacteraceae bacterium]
MNVLFATAEFAPLARVGGLAAAAAGYVAELRKPRFTQPESGDGISVEVVLPDYEGLSLVDEQTRTLDVPRWIGRAVARTGLATDATGAATIPVTLIDLPGIRRSHPYLQPDGDGWPDNDHRFMAFSTAVAALVMLDRPDVLHLNDWHTASTLAALDDPPPTVLTIHTLGYQGQSDSGWIRSFPYHHSDYQFGGAFNPLVGGIRRADLVISVSPHYVDEIRTDAGGFGVAGVLRDKGDRLVGILNGIDTDEWNPATDRHLTTRYDRTDPSPKSLLREQLLTEFGLIDGAGPLLSVVTRLAHQKGIDLIVPTFGYLRGLGARLVVLGSGEQHLVDQLDHAVRHYPDIVSFHNGYDEGLAHRMFAGSDVFVMPSRFEPCGLAQMQAMRYGTLPLVTDVGGLHDTVTDIDAFPTTGTGVVVAEPSAIALLDGIHRIARAHSNSRRRTAMRKRGMAIDWSWEQPAGRHVDWYRRLVAEHN